MSSVVDRDQLLHDYNMDLCEDHLFFEPYPEPEVEQDCPQCGGEGGWEVACRTYEPGCGFAHDDSRWQECHVCGGRSGFSIVPADEVRPLDLYDLEERCGDGQD